MSRLRSMTAIAGALAVMGCASVAPERPTGPVVVPSQTVRHGMDADAHYRTGRYFQGQLRFEQAMEAYRRALVQKPDHVDALNAMGVIHSLQQRPLLAEQSFRLALQADPQAARVHNNLGWHLLQNGRGAEAVAALERARELEPGNADTRANLLAARASIGMPAGTAIAEAVPAAAPATAPVTEPVTTPVTAPATEVVSSPVTAAVGPPVAAPAEVAAVPSAPQATAATGAAPAAARVEVSNGNGTTGLARRIASMLAPASALRPRLTNDKPFGAHASRIQYVGGAEQLAQDINARLPAPLPLARIESLERDVRVRVLLGRDFPPQPLAAQISTRRNS